MEYNQPQPPRPQGLLLGNAAVGTQWGQGNLKEASSSILKSWCGGEALQRETGRVGAGSPRSQAVRMCRDAGQATMAPAGSAAS